MTTEIMHAGAGPAEQPTDQEREGWKRDVRVIRNWVVFWSILQLVVLVAAAVTFTAVAVHVHDVNLQNQNSSLCQSLGGTDPSC